jgi:hypothetical protein
MTERKFGYGDDEVDGVQCPACTAGYDTTHPTVNAVAGDFDDQLRDDDEWDGMENGCGVVSEQQARRTWLGLIDNYGSDDEKRKVVAKKIARKLEWLN